MRKFETALLWLLVIDLGMALGAGLYEARVVLPAWVGTPPQTWQNTGLAFWAFVTTGPLTLLTIASAIVAWRRERGPLRTWWLAAVGVVIVERVLTFSYFIPTMVGLLDGGPLPQAEVDQTLEQWRAINKGRHVLNLAALLLSMKAFSLLERRDPSSGRSPV